MNKNSISPNNNNNNITKISNCNKKDLFICIYIPVWVQKYYKLTIYAYSLMLKINLNYELTTIEIKYLLHLKKT